MRLGLAEGGRTCYAPLRKPTDQDKGNDMDKFEKWVEYYRPHPNHLVPTASFDGLMFETYGEEFEYVRSVDINRVWTFISDGEGDRIEPGLRIVDRLGYFVTDEPWLEPEFEYVELETVEDEA